MMDEEPSALAAARAFAAAVLALPGAERRLRAFCRSLRALLDGALETRTRAELLALPEADRLAFLVACAASDAAARALGEEGQDAAE